MKPDAPSRSSAETVAEFDSSVSSAKDILQDVNDIYKHHSVQTCLHGDPTG